MGRAASSLPGAFKSAFAMILRFEAELGYKGSRHVPILSTTLASALKDPVVIDKKLSEKILLRRIAEATGDTISPVYLVTLGTSAQARRWRSENTSSFMPVSKRSHPGRVGGVKAYKISRSSVDGYSGWMRGNSRERREKRL